jgi:hypothetical protein
MGRYVVFEDEKQKRSDSSILFFRLLRGNEERQA